MIKRRSGVQFAGSVVRQKVVSGSEAIFTRFCTDCVEDILVVKLHVGLVRTSALLIPSSQVKINYPHDDGPNQNQRGNCALIVLNHAPGYSPDNPDKYFNYQEHY